MPLTRDDIREVVGEIIEPLQTDIHLVKKGLFDPDRGVYARVERNTLWRKIHMYFYMTAFSALVVAGAGLYFN